MIFLSAKCCACGQRVDWIEFIGWRWASKQSTEAWQLWHRFPNGTQCRGPFTHGQGVMA